MDVAKLALLIPIVALCIPIVAIVMNMGSGMLSKWMSHKQEMARIRSTSRIEMGQSAQSQFDILRNEIAQLRDTTTKYDISVEHSLSEVQRRLSALESSRQRQTASAPSPPPIQAEGQQIGLGRSSSQ